MSVMGRGLNFGRFFSHKNHKIAHTLNTKNGTNFYKTSPKFPIFGKVAKMGENAHFSRHLQNATVWQVCAAGAKFFCYF